jgi:hypothetical protein
LSIIIEKNGKKTIPRSIYFKILTFLVLIGLSAIAFRPVQLIINQKMAEIRAGFIEKLEIYTGMDILYSSIRPAFFGSFEIRNLKFLVNEEPILSISRTRIRFSLLELFLGKKNFVHTVYLDRPSLNIDMERDKEVLEKLFVSNNKRESNDEIIRQISLFLPSSADYRIWNCSFDYKNGQTAFGLENITMYVKGEDGQFLFNIDFNTEARFSGFANTVSFINTDIALKGSVSSDFESGSAEVVFSSLNYYQQDLVKRDSTFLRLASFNTDKPAMLFNLAPLTFNFFYNDHIISLQTPGNNENAGYSFSFNTKTSEASAEFNFNNFIPGNIINLSSNLNNYAHLLYIAFTGNVSAKYNNDGTFEYNADILAGDLKASVLNDAFKITASGNEKHIVIDEFFLNASSITERAGLFQGSIQYNGDIDFFPFSPSGSVAFDNLSFSGRDKINASFNIFNNNDEIRILSEKLNIGSSNLNEVNINLYHGQNDIDISITGFFQDNGGIFIDAVFSANPNQLEASLTANSLSFYNIQKIILTFSDFITIPAATDVYAHDTFIDAEMFFSSDFNNIVYNVPYIDIKRKDTIGTLSLTGTNHHVNLTEGVFYIGDNEMLVSANAFFSSPKDLDFTLNASFLDLAWNIKGEILDRTTLIIQDQNGLHAYGNISNSGEISGYIEGADYPIPGNEYPIYLNFYSTLRFKSKDFWSFDIAHFEAHNFFLDTEAPHIRFSGIADQDGASFRNITYDDKIGILAGNIDFSWDADFSYLGFLVNMTDGFEDGENYYLEGLMQDRQISAKANVSNIYLNRFIKAGNNMLLSADADVSWESFDSFTTRINLSSFKTNMENNEIHAAVDIMFSNDELLIKDLNVDFADINAAIPVIQVNRNEGIANSSVYIAGKANGRDLGVKINLDANFEKTDSWMNIRNAFNSFDGRLYVDDAFYGDLTNESALFVFSGEEGAISVSGGVRDMLRLEMDSEGNFYLGLSSPLPINGSIAGVYKDGIMDAHCSNFFIDLSLLWEFTSDQDDAFNISGGYIAGSIDMVGPVLNPEFFGSAMASSIRIEVPDYISEDIRPVPFNVIAEGYEMSFGPVVTACGNGSGYTTGWFRFENWTPKNTGLNLIIPQESPIPYKFNLSGLTVNGDASGTLDIIYDKYNAITEIKGDLFANNTEIGLYIENILTGNEDNMFVKEVEINTYLELSITTGTMVEFFWPSINNPILRANPEMGTVFNIVADTQSQEFSITSDIKIRSGELYYFDRSFLIRQGNIVFRENETQFNPRISARAETRDRSETGPVTIAMIIENEPLFSFIPRFEASPSLTQLEIYSFLGQNINTVQGSENPDMAQRFLLASTADIVSQIAANSDTLSQFIFFRQLERRFRNFLRLDMLNVRTRILQNAIISGTVGYGEGSSNRSTQVGNYFDNTTVFIGKYIGQDVFIQGSLTMKYDENDNTLGGLRFEPDIGIEWQSPYVNIRWDFFPSSPQNWWVTDNSITLSWTFSY